MASVTMTASFIAAAAAPARPSSISRRNFASAKTTTVCSLKATALPAGENQEAKEKEINSRRGIVLAAAAAIWAVRSAAPQMVALAEPEEPKPGTPEAKKKYYQVCVTMPTARICRK